MKFKSILVIFFVFCVTLSVNAQDKYKKSRFDVEAIRKDKAEFLKKELNLTDEEAKMFLPMEAEYMSKKYESNRDVRRETRALKEKENKTELDYERMTKLNLELDQRESKIQLEYFEKFKKILSAEKIERYRAADLKFKERILKEHRYKRKDDGLGK